MSFMGWIHLGQRQNMQLIAGPIYMEITLSNISTHEEVVSLRLNSNQTQGTAIKICLFKEKLYHFRRHIQETP